MYLWQKDSGFFFQMRIPAARAVNLGSTPLRVWLGPLRKREAQRRATTLAAKAVEGLRADMDRETLTRSLKALADELETLRRAEFSASLAVAGNDSAAREAEENGDDPELVTHYRTKWAGAEGRRAAVASVRQRLQVVGQALESDAAALTAERAAYAHALATVASIGRSAAPAQPLPVAVPAAPVPVAVAPVVSPVADEHRDEREITADTLLSVGGRIILDLRKEAKGESVKGDDRYQERLEHALEAFVDVIGDKPLRFYLPMHMQDFTTVMAKCPKNRKKYQQFKGISIRKMCEINARSKEPIPTLSTSAVSSLISEVGNLWAKVTAGVSEVKDIKNFRVTMPAAARKGIVREGLPVSSLNLWMKAAAALYPRDDFKKFMPLAALLTGMRQGELVWLQPKDIVEIDGHTIIDLRTPLLIKGKEVARSLKTETSPRLVALHPFLKEAGFLDFARNRRGWVFGEFHRAKDASRAAQGQMAVWMRGLGIHAEHKHVFHSLRHNAKHWIRVPLGKHIADRQCGHAPGSVGDGYGFPVLQTDEIEQIEALPLPKGVDFNGFLTSPKTRRGR
jgi:integrase